MVTFTFNTHTFSLTLVTVASFRRLNHNMNLGHNRSIGQKLLH